MNKRPSTFNEHMMNEEKQTFQMFQTAQTHQNKANHVISVQQRANKERAGCVL